MNENDAVKVWQLISAAFALSNAPLSDADEDETAIFTAYKNGDPDYQPSMSHSDLLKELGL